MHLSVFWSLSSQAFCTSQLETHYKKKDDMLYYDPHSL